MEEIEDVDEKDGITEPQITSLDPIERKLARGMRIQRRLEVIRKQQLQDDGVEETVEVVKSLLEEQKELSAEQLEQSSLEGKELVSNVRVANDTREVERREQDVVAREQRLQKLEQEAAASQQMFEDINAKWSEITASNDPLDIFQDMEAQKVKCRELLDQKNALIDELREEIKLVDERFDKDQRKQKQDLSLIVQRIDNQVNVMRRAYREELQLIEQAINTERRQQIDAANKRWETLFRERETEEVQNMEKKFTHVHDLAEEIARINLEHQEKFRETKITLENDIQLLQQELEQVKAFCLLNTEKLDYNLQVLKKRDEENIMIKAQQKRRINRLQDVANAMRAKIQQTQKSTETEKARLIDDVHRLHRNIVDVERKADHFSETNDLTYQQVWEMNAETAKQLLDQILTTDRLIYEQQLGLDWEPPDLSLHEISDLPSYRAAVHIINQQHHKDIIGPAMASHKVPSDVNAQLVERRLLHHILQRVADNSGFLVESRVFSLLFNYRKREKTLVKIDSVFSALGIKSEEDMLLMKNFFLPYAYCRICAEQQSSSVAGDAHEAETKSGSIQVEAESGSDDLDAISTQKSYDSHSTTSSYVMNDEFINGEDTFSQSSKATTFSNATITTPTVLLHSKAPAKAAACKTHEGAESECGHVLTIDTVHVLRALRDFITYFSEKKHKSPSNMSTRLTKKRNTLSRLLSPGDVVEFWNRFTQIFPPEKEKLWDGLFVGLQKYHVILEDRHKLNLETEKLRSQNAELRRLLQSYVPSNDVPPDTKLLYRSKNT